MVEYRTGVFRSARPTVDEVLQNNIKTIINLEWGFWDFLFDDKYERENWSKQGIIYIRCPLSDFSAPKPAKLQKLAWVIESRSLSGNVLIHCLSGKDRTGMVAAADLIVNERYTYEQAKADIHKNGMHFWYWWWIPKLKDVRCPYY